MIVMQSDAEPLDPDVPTVEEIQEAARRIAGEAVRTPLLESHVLNAATGARILLKPETLQRTGSFKFRGAYNAIAQIDPSSRARGVIAFSSGNHAQGVAEAARLFGIPATIVMPADAPALKIARTRAFGAEVVTYDREREDREEIAARLRADTEAHLVPPFDDPRIMAGQGTLGLEIAEDCRARDIVPDAALAPCSGGGLMAGMAIALADAFPGISLHTAEPQGFDDYARSLEAGRRLRNARATGSIQDALMAAEPGRLTFAVNRKLVTSGVSVSDEETLQAIAFAFRELKLVVEPGGASALAAVLNGRIPVQGRTVVVVLSGGNVDPEIFRRAISA